MMNNNEKCPRGAAGKVELRAELFNLNLQKSIGTLEKPHRIGELRKDIARVETALSAKKKEAASA